MKGKVLNPALILIAAAAMATAQPAGEMQRMLMTRSIHDAAAFSGSVEGVLGYYSDDAFLMPSPLKILHGKDSIRRWLTQDRVPLLSSPGSISVNKLGGTAFLIGTGQPRGDARSGGTILILQRTRDDSWLVTHNFWTGGYAGNVLLLGCFVLVPLCLCASLYAVIVYRDRWRLLGAIPLMVLAGYVAVVLIPAWLRHPASPMFPFELAIYLLPAVPYMIAVWAMRRTRMMLPERGSAAG